MKPVKAWIRKWIVPQLVYWLYRALYATWRVQVVEPESLKKRLADEQGIIFAHWHGHELAITHLVRRYKLATMTSKSQDGQLIDYVIHRLGGATAKGSSSRGAIGALKGLVRLVKTGHPASMAVDGPRGPLHKVKPGVFELSRLCRAEIFPVGCACSNAWVFQKSWNKAVLPKPFSKVCVYFPDPLPALQKTQDPKNAEFASRLESRIGAACQQASKLVDSKN